MARALRNQQTRLIANASSTVLAGPNPSRKALLISAPPTNRFTLSFGADAVLDQGITLYPAGPPLQLLAEDWG